MDATTNTLTKRLITDLGLEVTLVPDTTSTYDHCWTATCAAKDCNIYPCFAPCPICPKGYCILHDDNADVHPCAQLRDDFEQYFAVMGYSVKHGYLDTILKVASSPLVTQAIALRTKTYPEFPNPKCTFTIPAPPNGVGEHNPWAGRYNVHFPLDFDNGPRWLARVRGQDSAQPLGHEHAVLELLHGVVPQWTSRSWLVNNALILERLDGSQWSEDNNPNFSRAIKDVAVYYDRVSRLTFSGVGTLTPAGEPGPILHPNGSNLGPFRSLAEYHIASIDRALAGFHHGTHDHQRPRDILQTYLFNLEVRALVAADPNFAAQPTYLRHNDSHGGNWLVRESDGSLAGLIDWEFSYCTTFGDAFRAPEVLTGDNLGPLERRDPYDLNPPKLTSYEIALAAEYRSLGREDLATAVENADKFKMLEVTAERVPPDMTDMVRLRTAFTRISSPVDTASGAPAHAPAIKPASLPQSRNQWIAMTYARYGQHAGFQGMLRARQEWRNILCAAVQRAAEELEGKVSAVHWNDEEGEFDVQVDAEGGAEAEAD